MHILDVLTAGWILIILSALYRWLAARLFARRANAASVMGIAGNFTRMVLCETIAAGILARLKLLNAVTMVCLVGIAVIAAWLRRHGWTARSLTRNLQSTAVRMIRRFESSPSRADKITLLRQSISRPSTGSVALQKGLIALDDRGVLIAVGAAVLIITCILRCQHAVRELRFDQPEQYVALLHARGLLLNVRLGDLPLVFPALISITSLLSGADAMQVTRYLAPIIGVLVVVAAGLMVRACTRSGVASVIAMYCLGAAVFLPVKLTHVPGATWQNVKTAFLSWAAVTRVSTEDELGLLFFLLALAFLADWYWNTHGDSLADAACCLVLVALVSQTMLLMLVIVAMALLLRPALGLLALGVAGYGSAAYVLWSTGAPLPHELGLVLPVVAAVAVGCGLALGELAIAPAIGKRAEVLLLAACLVAAALWFPPRQVDEQFLEYEAAARKAQDIAYQFPRETWRIVAPVEQSPEIFGFGSYDDLATFVARYGDQVSNPEFRFPDVPEDLFIYVEKRPFQMFSREPMFVSFDVLTDATYRDYRSPAGRASLELAAWQLCENYRRHHSDLNVYYEDEYLRIYHLTNVSAPVLASSGDTRFRALKSGNESAAVERNPQ